MTCVKFCFPGWRSEVRGGLGLKVRGFPGGHLPGAVTVWWDGGFLRKKGVPSLIFLALEYFWCYVSIFRKEES